MSREAAVERTTTDGGRGAFRGGLEKYRTGVWNCWLDGEPWLATHANALWLETGMRVWP